MINMPPMLIVAFVYLRAGNANGARAWGVRVTVERELDAERAARAGLREILAARGDPNWKTGMEFLGLFCAGKAPQAEPSITAWGAQ
jgi:hypothetical protein